MVRLSQSGMTAQDGATQISAAQADEIARSMTAGTVGVVRLIDGNVYLMHVGGRTRVHIESSHMTRRGIAELVERCDPWPDA